MQEHADHERQTATRSESFRVRWGAHDVRTHQGASADNLNLLAPPGEEHWYGADVDWMMSRIAMLENDQNGEHTV